MRTSCPPCVCHVLTFSSFHPGMQLLISIEFIRKENLTFCIVCIYYLNMIHFFIILFDIYIYIYMNKVFKVEAHSPLCEFSVFQHISRSAFMHRALFYIYIYINRRRCELFSVVFNKWTFRPFGLLQHLQNRYLE